MGPGVQCVHSRANSGPTFCCGKEPQVTTRQMIEAKAETDGRYAIAYALLELVGPLQDLGFGRHNLANGTTERIAMELNDIATAIAGLTRPAEE